MRLLVLLVFLSLLAGEGHSLKILLYNPKSSKSHVNFINKIADVLLDAGHDVVSYMPSLDNKFGNGSNHKRARVIERECDFIEEAETLGIARMQESAWENKGSVLDMLKGLGNIGKLFRVSCEHQLADEAIMKQLRDENFDLGMGEFFDVCGFLLFHRIGLQKYVTLYSSLLPSMHAAKFGIPPLPSSVPEMHLSSAPPFSFWTRFVNHLQYLMSYLTLGRSFVEQVAQAAPEVDIYETMARSQLFFVNTLQPFDFPSLSSGKVVHIAGLGMQKALSKTTKLEEKYERVFREAKKGVVYISFGSVASSHKMPLPLKRMFLDAIVAFPEITFLKYEDPSDPIVQNIPNLVVDKWLPQQSIFAQDKLLAFISHGGMNSVVEAAYSGVTILPVPLFGDQHRNALMAEYRGTAIKLDKATMTSADLIAAIRRMVEDPSFKKNAKTMSELIRNAPSTPEERLVRNIEWAANFDLHSALDLPSRQLSTVAFYNIDVLCLMFVILLSVFVLLPLLVFKCMCGRRAEKNKRE